MFAALIMAFGGSLPKNVSGSALESRVLRKLSLEALITFTPVWCSCVACKIVSEWELE